MSDVEEAEQVDSSILLDEIKEESVPQEAEAPAVENPEKLADGSPEKNGVQERINKITADKWEEKRRADKLQEELDKLRTNSNVIAQVKKPKLEDFDHDEELYQDALIDYKVEQKSKERDATRQKSTEDQKQADLTKSFMERSAKMVSEKSDFNEALNKVPELQPSVLQGIMQDEKGPEIAYFLGTNLDEADRISSMNPVSAAIEIGRLSSRLSATKKIKPSSAPDPIEPISSGGKSDSKRGPVGATFE